MANVDVKFVLFILYPLFVNCVVIRIKPVKIAKFQKWNVSTGRPPLPYKFDCMATTDVDYVTEPEDVLYPQTEIVDYAYEYDPSIKIDDYDSYEDEPSPSWDDFDEIDNITSRIDDEITTNSVGGAVLDPRTPEASKNATYVVPLYGTTTSYAGYLRVNPQYGAYLFFWFYLSEKDPRRAPLVVWLQGQPGTSVLVGAFEEHGPYHIDSRGQIRKREYAWTNEYNVLYLDNCIPCGFSYTDDENGTTRTLEQTSEAVYRGLKQFFDVFDEFVENDMYLAGEYGCGKIIPMLGITIHKRNRSAKRKINLKGALIGNGIVDVNLMVNYGKFWFHWGLADANIMSRVGSLEEFIKAYILSDSDEEVLNYFRYHIFVKLSERDFNSPYDIRMANASTRNYVDDLAEDNYFRNWLHVGNQQYHIGHPYLSLRILRDTSHEVAELLDQGYKFLFYNGQFASLFSYDQTTRYLGTVGWSGLENWYRSLRKTWFVDNQLLGYAKTYDRLTQVLVRNAGHMVGQTQPMVLCNLLKYFIEDMFSNA